VISNNLHVFFANFVLICTKETILFIFVNLLLQVCNTVLYTQDALDGTELQSLIYTETQNFNLWFLRMTKMSVTIIWPQPTQLFEPESEFFKVNKHLNCDCDMKITANAPDG